MVDLGPRIKRILGAIPSSSHIVEIEQIMLRHRVLKSLFSKQLTLLRMLMMDMHVRVLNRLFQKHLTFSISLKMLFWIRRTLVKDLAAEGHTC
jgi:hypothetical protein